MICDEASLCLPQRPRLSPSSTFKMKYNLQYFIRGYIFCAGKLAFKWRFGPDWPPSPGVIHNPMTSRIHELSCGRHFTQTPRPRWTPHHVCVDYIYTSPRTGRIPGGRRDKAGVSLKWALVWKLFRNRCGAARAAATERDAPSTSRGRRSKRKRGKFPRRRAASRVSAAPAHVKTKWFPDTFLNIKLTWCSFPRCCEDEDMDSVNSAGAGSLQFFSRYNERIWQDWKRGAEETQLRRSFPSHWNATSNSI